MSDFATALEAARIGDITVSKIGSDLGDNDFVTKSQLLNTGVFDVGELNEGGYGDNDFVELARIAKGSASLTINVESSFQAAKAFTGITVSINNTPRTNKVTTSETITGVAIGSTITLTANQTGDGTVNILGYYVGGSQVKAGATYTFTFDGAKTIELRGYYLEVNPMSLSFEAEGGTKSFDVKSNITNWHIE